MESNYYSKYLKYREKYLSLKKFKTLKIQLGGAKCPRCGKDLEDCTCEPQAQAQAKPPLVLTDIPPELIPIIIKTLGLDDLLNFAQTNKHIQKSINDNIMDILDNIAIIEKDNKYNKDNATIINAFIAKIIDLYTDAINN